MKARIRKTGEIVDVIAWSQSVNREALDNVSYIDSKGVEHPRVNGMNFYWDFEKLPTEEQSEIDWEQRIYEIAKQMLPVTAKFTNGNPYKISIKDATMRAYEYAYELCRLIKQENKYNGHHKSNKNRPS